MGRVDVPVITLTKVMILREAKNTTNEMYF